MQCGVVGGCGGGSGGGGIRVRGARWSGHDCIPGVEVGGGRGGG